MANQQRIKFESLFIPQRPVHLLGQVELRITLKPATVTTTANPNCSMNDDVIIISIKWHLLRMQDKRTIIPNLHKCCTSINILWYKYPQQNYISLPNPLATAQEV